MFLGLLALLLVHYALQRRTVYELRHAHEEAVAARRDAAQVGELRGELERMRSFQARLLTMLGVERPVEADGDSLAPFARADGTAGGAAARGALQRAATLALAPPPDLWPTAGYVTREFIAGQPNRGVLPHPGIDIACPRETPVTAAGDGEIYRTGEDPYLGNFVEIQHGLGYLTVYGHCSRIAVARGERVERGQVVAYAGASGQTSAPHLHFEIWREGEAVDPRELLQGEPPRQ